VADIKSESRPASNRNRWPASYWNAWPASSETAIQTKCRTSLRSAGTLLTNCLALLESDQNAPRSWCGDTAHLMASSNSS
jgi:hypothetical protein